MHAACDALSAKLYSQLPKGGVLCEMGMGAQSITCAYL